MSETTPAPETDDTEGHMRNDGAAGSGEADDTEGHRFLVRNDGSSGSDDGDDDVEGHKRAF